MEPVTTRAGAPTRELLVQVAGTLLEEEGLEAVTLREVGRRAGLSRSAPYRHFASKEGLLTAVAAAGLRLLHRRLEDAAAARAGGPLERLGAMVEAYLAFSREHAELYRMLFAPIGRKREDPEAHEAAEGAVEAVARAVRAGVEAGLLPAVEPRALAALVVSTAHGAAQLERTGHLVAEKWGTDADGVVALLVRALAAAGEAEAAQPGAGAPRRSSGPSDHSSTRTP